MEGIGRAAGEALMGWGWLAAIVLFFMWRHQRKRRWEAVHELAMRDMARQEAHEQIGMVGHVVNLHSIKRELSNGS